MADTEYQFDRDSASRIAKTVRRVEAMSRPDGRGDSTSQTQVGPRVGLVMVTAIVPDANGYYRGRQYVAPQAPVQDPDPQLVVTDSPPGTTQVGNYTQYGQTAQGDDCWISWASGGTITPQLDQIVPGVCAAVYADGKPIYYVGGSSPTGWQTSFYDATPHSIGSAWSNAYSLSTPGVLGEIYQFELTFQWQLQGTSGQLVGLYAQIVDAANGSSVLVSQWNPFQVDAASSGGNAFTLTSTITFQATATASGLAPQLQVMLLGAAANYVLINCKTVSAWWTAKKLSPGALPSASTVNGQTGGINLVGSGPAGGVGLLLSTIGSTITSSLSPAAAAGINQALASNNV